MTKRKSRPPIPVAREVMQTKLLCLSPDQSIEDAVVELLRRGYSGAPVVDAQGSVRGVLSEYDCLRVLSESAFEGWPRGHVRDYMSGEVISVRPEEDLFALAARMAEAKHRRLLVVEGERLVGLVSRRDLMAALARLVQEQRKPTTYELIAKPEGRERI